MEIRLSSNVADLSDEQRKVLESLTGLRLEPEQVLYWVVASPGKVPAEADKAQARAGMQNLFAKIDRHAATHGASSAAIEAAIDAAVRQVRSQPDA